MSPKERIYTIGGTGNLAGMKGAGTIHIQAVPPTDRDCLSKAKCC